MTHDPNILTTAFSVMSSAVSMAKNAVDLSKNVTDHALKAAVGDVLDSVLDAKLKMSELGDENGSLRKRIEELETLAKESGKIARGEHGYWFKEAETDPLCPKCWEGSKQITYLSPVQVKGSWKARTCPVCDFTYQEDRIPFTGVVRSSRLLPQY